MIAHDSRKSIYGFLNVFKVQKRLISLIKFTWTYIIGAYKCTCTTPDLFFFGGRGSKRHLCLRLVLVHRHATSMYKTLAKMVKFAIKCLIVRFFSEKLWNFLLN